MSEPPSPIDELIESLRASLAAKRRDAVSRIERVEAALASYRRAVEHELAARFAAEHQLKAPSAAFAGVAHAASELARALRELPELRAALGANESNELGPSASDPPAAKRAASKSSDPEPAPSEASELRRALARG